MVETVKPTRTVTLTSPVVYTVILSLLEICVFTTLMVLSAYLRIPVPGSPVPVTLQVLIVLLAPLMIGAAKGALSQVFYLSLGAAGLPVFAGGAAGFAYLFGPTGGYLIAFLFTPILIGFLKGKKTHHIIHLCLVLLLGVMLIHTLGIIWLSVSLGVALKHAFIMGSAPFLIWDLLKIVLALATLKVHRNISATLKK